MNQKTRLFVPASFVCAIPIARPMEQSLLNHITVTAIGTSKIIQVQTVQHFDNAG